MIPLTLTPDELFIIGDETEVTTRLAELNLCDAVKAAETKIPVGIKKTGFRIFKYDHPTHWIAVDFFTMFDRPQDNGYAIIAAPKSKLTKHGFHQRLPKTLNFSKIHYVENLPSKPPQN